MLITDDKADVDDDDGTMLSELVERCFVGGEVEEEQEEEDSI
jgi:hypothetical protein